MNETQRRIKAYKAALPGLRERVIAVALLLAMSVAMMTSATFAWITLSRAPEVSGVSTTVAANGNLEIALAQGEAESIRLVYEALLQQRIRPLPVRISPGVTWSICRIPFMD